MKVDIHCKGMSVTEAIRSHTEDKLSKLDRILPGEIDVMVVLTYEGGSQLDLYEAEISFRALGNDIVSKAEGEDLYKAVTEASDQVLSRIKRLKSKRQDQRKGGTSIKDLHQPEPTGAYTEADRYEDEYEEALEQAKLEEEKQKELLQNMKPSDA